MPRRPLRWAHATLSILDPLPVSLPILKPGLFVAFSVFLHVGTDFSFLPLQPCFRARVQQVVCCLFIASLPARTSVLSRGRAMLSSSLRKTFPREGQTPQGGAADPELCCWGFRRTRPPELPPLALTLAMGDPLLWLACPPDAQPEHPGAGLALP